MRTNGFIFIAWGFVAVATAGTSGYLPSVGPLGLRFERAPVHVAVATLPAPAPDQPAETGAITREEIAVELPVPSPPEPPTTTMMHDAPVTLPDNLPGALANPLQNLIGPMVDTNGVVAPQMFLRFFTPPQGGISREAILVNPPGFNPALPPARSSTATYIQTKP